MRTNTAHIGLTALAALGLTACSGGSSDSAGSSTDTGTLTVGLMDTPVRDVDAVWVCVTQINVKPQQGTALEFALPDADEASGPCDGEQFDLLSLRSVASAELLINGEEVPAGAYNWIELELDAASPGQGQTDSDGPYDSYVMVGDAQYDLIMPSGSVRLVSGFSVTAGQHTRFTIDWDVQQGLSGIVAPPGQDGYMLRPAFRIVDETVFGTLNGTIATQFVTAEANSCNADDDGAEGELNYDVGNVVYLFARDPEDTDDSDDVDDTDENEPNPYATVAVAPNADMTAYVYETIVAPGEYTLAFTCQGDNDDPDTDDNDAEQTNVEFHPENGMPITITEGETTTVDFPM